MDQRHISLAHVQLDAAAGELHLMELSGAKRETGTDSAHDKPAPKSGSAASKSP